MSDVEVLDDKFVHLSIVYNPFDPTNLAKHELDWHEGVTLGQYLHDLENLDAWHVSLNGVLIEPSEYDTREVNDRDIIVLVSIPEGSVKDVVRMVALIAVFAIAYTVAPYLATAWGWGSFGEAMLMGVIGIGGALLVNAVIPPQALGAKSATDDTKETSTYGIDGAKNSAEEGLVVPAIYGEPRIGGNFVDLNTENRGTDQTLILRTAIGDGLVTEISDPEINEQPISFYKNAEFAYGLGESSPQRHPWFKRAVVLDNKGAQITPEWITHATNENVDQVRFDIVFNRGLMQINEETGDRTKTSVTLVTEYSDDLGVTWRQLPINQWMFTSGPVTAQEVSGMRVTVARRNRVGGPIHYVIEYRKVGAPSWTVAYDIDDVAPTVVGQHSYHHGLDDPDYNPFPSNYERTFDITGLDYDRYEVRVTGDVTFDSMSLLVAGANTITYEDNFTQPRRYTIECEPFPERKDYLVRIRRNGAASTSQYVSDDVYLTDVGEITISDVALAGTAWAAARIKMTNQLSRIPLFTVKVKGHPLQKYDIHGQKTVEEHTASPAWVALDILIGEIRGAGLDPSHIDFPAWVEWAEYCEENDIRFSAVFDTELTVWDALRAVFYVGNAQPVRVGTKWSVAIDRKEQPVMLFGEGNIIQDTFETSYLPVIDRANEVEAVFFDKDDRNKPKSLRVADPSQYEAGTKQKKASLRLFGVDNAEQANKMLWRQIYSNRYIIRTAKFDAPIEAIGLNIGDVALIAHPVTNYAETGRLLPGSTATRLKLDHPVTMEAGKTYGVMVMMGPIKRYDVTVQTVTQSRVIVSGLPAGLSSDHKDAMHRLLGGGKDVEIIGVTENASNYTLLINGSASGFVTGQSVEIWQNDAIEERTVVLVPGETEEVQLASALPMAPTEYANFFFGEMEYYKRPYRLKTIEGTDVDRRTLSWVEYNERVYDAPGLPYVPPKKAPSSKAVEHVSDLQLGASIDLQDGQTTIIVTVSWIIGDPLTYRGADVYRKPVDGEWMHLGTSGGTSFESSANQGDLWVYKVVARGQNEVSAVFDTAPTIEYRFNTNVDKLVAPQAPEIEIVAFDIHATVKLTWGDVTDARKLGYELRYKKSTDSTWETLSAFPEPIVYVRNLDVTTYDFEIRSVGLTGRSDWVAATFEVGSPELPPITGLTINNQVPDQPAYQFVGRDVLVDWDEAGTYNGEGRDYFLRDYVVQILSADGQLVLRTDYVTDSNYSYTFEKNLVDGAGRDFMIRVLRRGMQGQFGNSATVLVVNPAASDPTGQYYTTTDAIHLRLNQSEDRDFRNFRVLVNNAESYVGADTNITVGNLQPGTEYEVTVYARDVFGGESANSLDFVATTKTIGESLAIDWRDITDLTGTRPADNADVTGDMESVMIRNPRFADKRNHWDLGADWSIEENSSNALFGTNVAVCTPTAMAGEAIGTDAMATSALGGGQAAANESRNEEFFAVSAGERVVAQFMAKVNAQANGTIVVGLGLYTASGTIVEDLIMDTAVQPSTSWTRVRQSFTIPDTAGIAKAKIIFQVVDQTQGKWYVDDLQAAIQHRDDELPIPDRLAGLYANIPDAGTFISGTRYFATDRGHVYEVQGGTWVLVSTKNLYRGAWNAETVYDGGDIVSYNGSTYIYISGNEQAGIVPTNATYWDLMVPGGERTSYMFKRSASTPTLTAEQKADPSPAGWTDGIPDGTDFVWMIQARINAFGDLLGGGWSNPVRVSGEDGLNGVHVDFRFKVSETQPTKPADNDANPDGWLDAPAGSPAWMVSALKNPDGSFATPPAGSAYQLGKWSDVVRVTGERGENVRVQYSQNGTDEWHDTFDPLVDVFMRVFSDGTWGAAARIVGEDGTNGEHVDYRFRYSLTDLSTEEYGTDPAPEFWTDAPTGGGSGEMLFMIKARFKDGAMLDPWSLPVRLTGDQGPQGEAGSYIDFIFIRAATRPTTPTGEAPSGWSGEPPAANGQPLWMSKAERLAGGSLSGAWSQPQEVGGSGLEVQYSADGAAPWGQSFIQGTHFFMRQRLAGGGWSAAMRIVGENGLDGNDGGYFSIIFRRAATRPDTPNGNTPSGWYDGPPAANGQPLWMSKGFMSPLDVLQGSWTVPQEVGGSGLEVEYSANGTSGWSTSFIQGTHLFMRQRLAGGGWSAAIRIVGENGANGADGNSTYIGECGYKPSTGGSDYPAGIGFYGYSAGIPNRNVPAKVTLPNGSNFFFGGTNSDEEGRAYSNTTLGTSYEAYVILDISGSKRFTHGSGQGASRLAFGYKNNDGSWLYQSRGSGWVNFPSTDYSSFLVIGTAKKDQSSNQWVSFAPSQMALDAAPQLGAVRDSDTDHIVQRAVTDTVMMTKTGAQHLALNGNWQAITGLVYTRNVPADAHVIITGGMTFLSRVYDGSKFAVDVRLTVNGVEVSPMLDRVGGHGETTHPADPEDHYFSTPFGWKLDGAGATRTYQIEARINDSSEGVTVYPQNVQVRSGYKLFLVAKR